MRRPRTPFPKSAEKSGGVWRKDMGSLGSDPANTWSNRAVSATVRVIGPDWEYWLADGRP